MVEVIHESKLKARKDYRCDACDFMLAMLCDVIDEMTWQEKKAVVKARRNKWLIKKGENYIRQFNRDGGDTWTFRAIPAISDICFKYELFYE